VQFVDSVGRGDRALRHVKIVMTTQSTGEAMALLKKYRADQIEDARDVACELIERYGYTSIRQVQETMVEMDLIDENLGNFWLGAVFNDPRFEWNGKWDIPDSGALVATKNKAHDYRPVKIWIFSKHAF
jgi:hypothetical protein